MKTDDLEIVKQVQAGNKQAFDLLIKKYQGRIKRLIGRIVADIDSHDDITQETLIRAYKAINSFRGDSAFYTWLYRIAVNTAKNYTLEQSRRIKTESTPEEITVEDLSVCFDTPESLLDRDQIAKALSLALQALPQDLRITIVMREIEGLSYEEIASALNCPVGTVRSRISRAREHLFNSIH